MAGDDASPQRPSASAPEPKGKGYEEGHTYKAEVVTPTLVDSPRPDEAHAKSLTGFKILAVDDDVRNLFAVTSLLERHGATALPAATAKEAVEVLEKNPEVSAVLMDMMMPEVDGYQATRQLREMPRYRTLPIIALTAKTMPGDRDKALEAGCTDFVSKPVERERLIAVLRQWLPKEKAG
jgi:CheY-like chemotaxis protein